MTEVRFNLSGVHLVLSEMSPSLAERFRNEWQDYVSPNVEEPALHARFATSDVEVAGKRFDTEMQMETAGGRACFTLPEGRIELVAPGQAELRLATSSENVQFYAASNLLCAALAWTLPERGMLLLHAAGIVVNGRAFLLVGASGSGKSTWANLAKEAGALFLSDDLIFVAVSGSTEVLSMPFRGNHPKPHGPARWPLAAILLPVHGSAPSLAPARKLEVASRITANLLFLSDRRGGDPQLVPLIDRLIAGAPAFHFTFGLKQGFLECLEALAV